jgi:outer membrane protein assembly factor BamE (lipoprotein component of BamABCDE complex)
MTQGLTLTDPLPRCRNRSQFISILLTLFVLSGCVYQQQGQRFDASAINQLIPGSSTEQDAIAKLGKPISVSTNADGSQVLQWYYVYGTAIGVGGGAHAAILFGVDGKMIRVTNLSQV